MRFLGFRHCPKKLFTRRSLLKACFYRCPRPGLGEKVLSFTHARPYDASRQRVGLSRLLLKTLSYQKARVTACHTRQDQTSRSKICAPTVECHAQSQDMIEQAFPQTSHSHQRHASVLVLLSHPSSLRPHVDTECVWITIICSFRPLPHGVQGSFARPK
jgi:hypothetical protein